MHDDPSKLVGTTLSGYRIDAQIAQGGMGWVYRAEDVRLGRTVALKLLPTSQIRDRIAKERFLQEARAASALEHPNVCTLYQIGETDDGLLFFAMGYAEGESLKERLARGLLKIGEVVDITLQILAGLGHAHQRGIIHRDIKPGNIFLTRLGEVKILDFGLAKALGEIDDLTMSNVSLGTPAYMSPEQTAGREVGLRSDLWSLGVLLYEALAGQRPFQAVSVPALIYAIHHTDPADLRRLRPDVPEGLAEVVKRLLSRFPNDRFASCAEIAEALEPFADLSLPVTRRALAETTTASRSSITLPRIPIRRPQRPGLLGAGLVLLIGLLAFVVLSWRGASSTEGSVSIAVLLFDNLSADPEVEWMRTGLTEMLVTDLSQSTPSRAGLHVLPTLRVYQALGELGLVDHLPTFRVAEKLGEHLDVDQLVLGSYARIGEILRIQIHLQDARSGRSLLTRQAEGRPDELFSLIDRLAAEVRRSVAIDVVEDLEVAHLLTSSLPAYEFFAKGLRLHLDFDEAEAHALFLQAVEIDPEFSLAWARLAITHSNLGRPNADIYYEKAVETADRLPPGERFYIHGLYGLLRSSTWSVARRAFESSLEAAPELDTARHNLVYLLGRLEDFKTARLHNQILLERRFPYLATLAAAIQNAAAEGREDEAVRFLERLVQDHSGNAMAQIFAGMAWRWLGKYETSHLHLERGAKLLPDAVFLQQAHCGLELLTAQAAPPPETDGLAAEALPLDDPMRAQILGCRQYKDQLAGRSDDALRSIDQLIESMPEARRRAVFHLWAARLQLARGEADDARRHAETAIVEGSGDIPESRGLLLAIRADLAQNRLDDARRRTAELESKVPERSPLEQRLARQARGLLALAEGDAAGAVEELEAAASELPVRSQWVWLFEIIEPDQVPIRWHLAEAYVAAGRSEDAAGQWQRIIEATDERIPFPTLYVRSLERLASFHRIRRETAEAQRYERRFRAFWADGKP